MFVLCKKEIRYFFTSPIGWTVVAISVILNGLFLWILQTDYNIFNSGFADLLPFFKLSSWMFVFLIPALTMRSISEEKKNGMLGLLLTKPISTIALVFGKYFRNFISDTNSFNPFIVVCIYALAVGEPCWQFRCCYYHRFIHSPFSTSLHLCGGRFVGFGGK
ncbi:membrane hypothetical protein [Capnocytophaga canimorsus]|uniref:Uncharacterized protein n=1 Tax=Capnocytophaga canimorsus TaxID=28188 RepID=A0A0B7IFB6_9FLAO|nr:membrane hypothetical protein [Capnocytophaga canimorsus]